MKQNRLVVLNQRRILARKEVELAQKKKRAEKKVNRILTKTITGILTRSKETNFDLPTSQLEIPKFTIPKREKSDA